MAFDPVEAEKYLEGVEYPLSKQELIARAEENGAPQEMIEDLQAYEQERFDGPSAVQGAFGRS